MEPSYLSFLLFSLLTTLARAQQGVLTDGNSQLPECAVSCPLLIQAAQACSATDVASQSAWICFCQSAYLTTLKTSAVGICDSVCTDTTQNAQVSTWYNSNCGDDFGASEHADDAGAQPTATAADNGDNGADATQTAGSKPTKTAGSSAANSQSGAGGSQDGQCHGTWWDCHFQWIIMVLVLAICLPLLGWAGHWLKRRYERKADKPSSGFNAGITDRAPPMSNANFNASGAVAGPSAVESSGRPGSPARTRDAFMPYGYGYAHSDSRLPSQQDRRSPLARGETPGGDA